MPGRRSAPSTQGRSSTAPGPLSGRDAELASLRAWWEQASAGRAGRVLLTGPAGVGKSALVDAFADAATANVVRVEADGDRRPGAFLDLLTAALGIGTVAPGPDEAATPLLAALGAHQDHGVVVVVLHDLSGIDDVSRDALLRALRRLHHDRVLVLATARPDVLDTPWARLFADGPGAATWSLSGLDVGGVRDLVALLRPGRWSRRAIARLHEDTVGNPLHLRTLLHELPDDVLLGDAPLPAPRSLAEDVAAVSEHLSPPARRLLACLAVLGHPARRALLTRLETLHALSPAAVATATDELAHAGLLDTSGLVDRARLALHHPLVRHAVYADLHPDERTRLHLDAARALGGAPALSHRVAAASGRPDARLADELEAAAQADAVDGGVAATRLLAAADLSATGSEAQRRLLAAALRLVDLYDTDRLLALAPSVRAADPGPERDVVLGFLLSRDHDPAAVVHLQAALDAADAPSEVRALAGVRLALEHVVRGRGQAADVAAAQVPALTTRPVRIEQAAIMQALGRAQQHGPSAGLALLESHLPGALGADPAITAGTLELAAGQVAAARAHLEEGVARARRGAASTSTHRAHCHLAEALYRTGRWDLAAAEAEIALEWFLDGDRAWAEALAHAVAALVPAARGQSDEATAHLDAARAALRRSHSPQGAHAVALAEATRCRSLGDGAGMERALRELPAAAARGGFVSGPFAPWRPLHAEALIATGDVVGARRALRSWPRTGAPRWFQLARHQMQGRLARASGDLAGAQIALRAGIALAEAHPVEVAEDCPVELAELRVLLASLPSVADASEQLDAARGVLDALAATPWLEQIRAARPPTGPTPIGRRALTPRERQVVDLVARGMTSREAAEVLWVTPKAVDYHLGNIYAKLGISSRRQLRAEGGAPSRLR